jgi:nicotinamidase-related amidase
MALPLPPHFDPDQVAEVWRVPYQERAEQAERWAAEHAISPATESRQKVALLLVDVQNTFCIPGFELFVGSRSGRGAVEDNLRLCRFLYANLGRITQVVLTLDTHRIGPIFHPCHLVSDKGEHPAPFTLISVADVEAGRWHFNRALASSIGVDPDYAERNLLHYTRRLAATGKYQLTVWPYHAMLGGIGHALVSAVEEAVFFHGITRASQPRFEIKGDHPLTEHYSVLGPEVLDGPNGATIGTRNLELVDDLLRFDALIVAGQAKSHCVAWTLEDLIAEDHRRGSDFSKRIYLLEDCCSPVVIPRVIDYTEAADEAFERFAAAGAHRVRSDLPMSEWPGFE